MTLDLRHHSRSSCTPGTPGYRNAGYPDQKEYQRQWSTDVPDQASGSIHIWPLRSQLSDAGCLSPWSLRVPGRIGSVRSYQHRGIRPMRCNHPGSFAITILSGCLDPMAFSHGDVAINKNVIGVVDDPVHDRFGNRAPFR